MLPDNDFWRSENLKLWGEVDELALASLYAGAAAGISLLPSSVQPLADMEVFNAAAMRYLRLYQLTTVQNITDTTRRLATRMIEDWLRSGEALPELETKLATILNDRRAAQIAVTEVTRIFAKGNLMLWNTLGVVTSKVWQTANDEKVCPLCGPLHGQVVSIESNFEQTVEGLAGTAQMKRLLGPRYNEQLAQQRAQNLIKWHGSGIEAPPRHVNCLPGDALVLSIGGVAGGSKRWYKGDVVTIETLEHNLTVTPNHPILTDRGWVPAGEIHEGDNVIGYRSGEWESILVEVDNQNMVSSIEDVFGSLSLVGFRVPVSAPDFHGDGTGSDVAIIRPNSNVLNHVQPEISQPSGQGNLLLGDVIPQISLSGLGSLERLFERNLAPSTGIMGGGDLLAPLACGHALPLGLFGSGLTPGFDTGFEQSAPKGAAIDTGLPGEFVLGLPSNITLQQVAKVRNSYFSGHVYNLQTESGLFVADGIITHNCRCWLQPVVSVQSFEESLGGILS